MLEREASLAPALVPLPLRQVSTPAIIVLAVNLLKEEQPVADISTGKIRVRTLERMLDTTRILQASPQDSTSGKMLPLQELSGQLQVGFTITTKQGVRPQSSLILGDPIKRTLPTDWIHRSIHPARLSSRMLTTTRPHMVVGTNLRMNFITSKVILLLVLAEVVVLLGGEFLKTDELSRSSN